MIWDKCKLYKNAVLTGTDDLGNPIYGDPQLVAVINCRASAFDNTLQSLEQRDVTENTQYFALADNKKDIPEFDFAEICGNKYKVHELINSGPRWTIIRCRIYGL